MIIGVEECWLVLTRDLPVNTNVLMSKQITTELKNIVQIYFSSVLAVKCVTN